MEVVTQLGPHDVLFGRGSGPNDHEGNIRFRKLVAARKAEYMATNHRMTKAKIAREIVDSVFAENGRFLKKLEPEEARHAGIPDGVDAWTGVDDDTIMEKAKQALRQNTSKYRGPPTEKKEAPLSSNTAAAAPDVYTPNPPSSLGAAASGPDLGSFDLEPIPIPATGYHANNNSNFTNVIPSASGQKNTRPGNMPPPPNNPKPADDGFHMPPPPRRASELEARQLMATLAQQNKGHRDSLDMSGLMDSLRQERLVTGVHDSSMRMGSVASSVRTMGTIEPMDVGSTADMSMGTIASSIFSTMKDGDEKRPPRRISAGIEAFEPSNELSFSELEIEQPPSYIQAYTRRSLAGQGQLGVDPSHLDSSLRMGSAGKLASEASITISDLPGKKKSPFAMNKQPKDDSLKGTFSVSGGSDNGSGIEGMGSSSLNLLKGMLMSQDEMQSIEELQPFPADSI